MTSALIVIDMQNAFLHPDGSLARLGADVVSLRHAIPGCVSLVEAARANGVPIIHIQSSLRSDYLDGGLIFNEISGHVRTERFLVRGSWDADIIDELRPLDDEFVVEKLRFSAFYGTSLDALLASVGIREVTIAGVTTSICVETTARDAGQRDLRTHVVRDATAETDDARFHHSLSLLEFAFCRISTVQDTTKAWA